MTVSKTQCPECGNMVGVDEITFFLNDSGNRVCVNCSDENQDNDNLYRNDEE